MGWFLDGQGDADCLSFIRIVRRTQGDHHFIDGVIHLSADRGGVDLELLQRANTAGRLAIRLHFLRLTDRVDHLAGIDVDIV